MKSLHRIYITLSAAFIALLATIESPANSWGRIENAARILIFEEAEDATSYFEYIYLLDDKGNPFKIVEIWNGGCCQAPIIEEFILNQNRFELVKSYTLSEKPGNFSMEILCNQGLETMPVEPTNHGKSGFKVEEIENHHIDEADEFIGCK